MSDLVSWFRITNLNFPKTELNHVVTGCWRLLVSASNFEVTLSLCFSVTSGPLGHMYLSLSVLIVVTGRRYFSD